MANTEQQRQYQELEAAIMRKVHPEAVYDEQMESWAFSDGDGGYFLKKPGLEDVLRALPEKEITFSRWRYEFHIRKKDRLLCGVWQLGKPLSDQSDECKKFIHSLLLP